MEAPPQVSIRHRDKVGLTYQLYIPIAMLVMILSGKCSQVMTSTAGAEEFPQPAQTKGVLLLAHLLTVRNIWLEIAAAEAF